LTKSKKTNIIINQKYGTVLEGVKELKFQEHKTYC